MSTMSELDAVISVGTITKLTPGRTYQATVTGTVRGVRKFRELTFVAGRPSVEANFIEARPDVLAQDRIFYNYPSFGACPALVVRGSIREVSA